MNTRRACAAFTLIEVLVVVAIVSILAALLFSGLQNLQSRAERTKCAANLRQVGVGISLYTQENDLVTPRLDHQIVQDLFPYLYPNTTSIPVISGTGFPPELLHTVFACPSMHRDTGNSSARSYGYNAPLISSPDNPAENKTGTRSPRLKMQILAQPTKVMLYGDTWNSSAIQFSRIAQITARHGGSFNVLMADGRVENIPLDDQQLQTSTSILWRGY